MFVQPIICQFIHKLSGQELVSKAAVGGFGAGPHMHAMQPSESRAMDVRAAALGDLPEWDLSDLYPGRDSAALTRDLATLAADAEAFRKHYQGRLADLSGVPTQRVVMIAFALCGALAAFGGVLLAGYAGKAAQSMGDAYLLPAIAAVVLGGTSILGGRGSYLGTIAGAILITLLQSILSVMQIAEFGRQIIYGVIIIVMLLLYGREKVIR